MSLSDANAVPSGTVLAGRYRVTSLLGQGGMGQVYLADDTQLGRPVVLKLLAGGHDRQTRERFAREMRALARFNHPNIVAIYDHGQTDQTPFLAMEHVDGLTLREYLRARSPLPVDVALTIVDQALNALVAAHDEGFVHRDLKPANIMLTQKAGGLELVKVLDFGIAKALAGPDPEAGGLDGVANTLTTPGALVGTPHYMAPEQILGEGVDARTDLYALGCILYEMLTNAMPVDADTPRGMLLGHLQNQLVPISDRDPALPGGVVSLVDVALANKKDDRFASAMEMQARVREHLSGVASLGLGALLTGETLPPLEPGVPDFSGDDTVVPTADTGVGLSVGHTEDGASGLAQVTEDATGPGTLRSGDTASPAAVSSATDVDGAPTAPPALAGQAVALTSDAVQSAVPATPAAVSVVPAPTPPARHSVVGWIAAAVLLATLIAVVSWTLGKQESQNGKAASAETAPPPTDTVHINPPPVAPLAADAPPPIPEDTVPMEISAAKLLRGLNALSSAAELGSRAVAAGEPVEETGNPRRQGQKKRSRACPDFSLRTSKGCEPVEAGVWPHVESCQDGDRRSCLTAARTYLDNDDLPPLIAIYEMACKAGDYGTCFYLGNVQISSDQSPAGIKKAVRNWERACKHNVLPACEELANEYADDGDLLPANPQRSAKLSVRLCESQWHSRCLQAAEAFIDGVGVPRDLARARELLTIGCESRKKNSCERLESLP